MSRLSHIELVRSILLCNVLVKVISKVLANRLKPMMSKITAKMKSIFIPGRLITSENITAPQEIIHSLSRQKGLIDGFVVKVDLEKAYDRVDNQVMPFSGFNSHICSLIMHCIPLTSLLLL